MTAAPEDVRRVVPPRASTVVLTGAGFSVPAGLPVASDILRVGRERVRSEFLAAVDSLAEDVLGEPLGQDAEAILTRLRVLELYSNRDYLEEILPLELGIYFLIWAALRTGADPPAIYDTFVERLGGDVAYASLNYDLVLETVLRRKQRSWHYPLQGEWNSLNELRYSEEFYSPWDRDPKSVSYLKLHGSFNWQYCWRCNYFRVVRDEWSGVSEFYVPRRGHEALWAASRGTLACDECVPEGPGASQAVLKPLIIPPTRLKEYSRAPVRRQWAFFDLLLAQAEKLIVIGSSIRDEDVLLYNSLSFLAFKSPRLKRIVAIDPQECVAQRLKLLTEVEPTWYASLEDYVGHEDG
jgi:hypothetical protein